MAHDVGYISGLAYVPIACLARVDRLRSRLVVYPRQFDDRTPVQPIQLFDTGTPGHIGLPIDWALNEFPSISFTDRTSIGEACYHNRLPDFRHPLAPAGQGEFASDLLRACRDHYAVFAKGSTGVGKTVVALATAATLGRRTLAIVQTSFLAGQWKERIQEHLGVPADDIGLIRSGKCDFEHPFNIVIAKSLSMRDYPIEFYTSHGTVIYDELHRFGAPLFSTTVGIFTSRYKIGLTATGKRKDGLEKVFIYYFGQPKVISRQEAVPCTVNVLSHKARIPQWCKRPNDIAHAVKSDEPRNWLIVKVISRLFREGRNILVIGDSVEHLQHLQEMCEGAGIPPVSTGLFVGQRYTGELRRSDKGQMVPAKMTVKPKELERIRKDSRVIFATYGMMKEGADIPRLDAGIDVSPRADGEQVIGRIRRVFGGKTKAIWYTLADMGHPVAERYTRSRIKDYRVAGAEIIRHAQWF